MDPRKRTNLQDETPARLMVPYIVGIFVGTAILIVAAWTVGCSECSDGNESTDRPSADDVRRTYNEVSIGLRDRVYERPPNPPGWSLTSGSSAELLWEANDLCRASLPVELLDLEADDLIYQTYTAALDAMAGEAAERPPTTAFPEPCLHAGFPSNTPVSLSAAICEIVVACRPTFEMVREAVRMREATSPLDVWRSGLQPGEGINMADITWKKLPQLMLLDAYFAWLSGNGDAPIQAAETVMLMGNQLGHGSGGVGGGLGSTALLFAVDFLHQWLRSGSVTEAQAMRTIEVVHYILDDAPEFRDLVEPDYVIITPSWLCEQDLEDFIVPPNRLECSGESDLRCAEQYTRSFDRLHRVEQFTERAQLFEELASDRWGGDRLIESWERFDRTDVLRHHVRPQIIALLAAAIVHQHQTGHPPSTFEELYAIVNGPIIDPLTDESYSLEVTREGELRISSMVRDTDTGEALEDGRMSVDLNIYASSAAGVPNPR